MRKLQIKSFPHGYNYLKFPSKDNFFEWKKFIFLKISVFTYKKIILFDTLSYRKSEESETLVKLCL